ncbi:MAG: C40 family peptidase [Verrucomicrobiae bacterium]|nr:C40 family peptidase [Verrucomicrobiae bacterium]NNJ85657.1 peptidoglycan endopeptidase [Akkermansiaceae bacterium]
MVRCSWLQALSVWCLLTIPTLHAEKNSYTSGGVTYYRPGTIKTSDLIGYKKLPANRQKLIKQALYTASNNKWLKYKFGGANPSAGGFDCSGAMYYILRHAGYQPPRTSAQQYVWLRNAKLITKVEGRPLSLDDKAFNKLTPGDLLFWSGTYRPTDGRTVNITHVSLYLGKEKDGRHVMAGASKGRSYRGKKGDGYGVYDFRLPRKGSKSRFVGFGSPAGYRK